MFQNKTNRDITGMWALVDAFISHQTIQNYNSIIILDHIKSLNLDGVSMTVALILINTTFSEKFSKFFEYFSLNLIISVYTPMDLWHKLNFYLSVGTLMIQSVISNYMTVYLEDENLLRQFLYSVQIKFFYIEIER